MPRPGWYGRQMAALVVVKKKGGFSFSFPQGAELVMLWKERSPNSATVPPLEPCLPSHMEKLPARNICIYIYNLLNISEILRFCETCFSWAWSVCPRGKCWKRVVTRICCSVPCVKTQFCRFVSIIALHEGHLADVHICGDVHNLLIFAQYSSVWLNMGSLHKGTAKGPPWESTQQPLGVRSSSLTTTPH